LDTGRAKKEENAFKAVKGKRREILMLQGVGYLKWLEGGGITVDMYWATATQSIAPQFFNLKLLYIARPDKLQRSRSPFRDLDTFPTSSIPTCGIWLSLGLYIHVTNSNHVPLYNPNRRAALLLHMLPNHRRFLFIHALLSRNSKVTFTLNFEVGNGIGIAVAVLRQ
jgi:hypothetical protein